MFELRLSMFVVTCKYSLFRLSQVFSTAGYYKAKAGHQINSKNLIISYLLHLYKSQSCVTKGSMKHNYFIMKPNNIKFSLGLLHNGCTIKIFKNKNLNNFEFEVILGFKVSIITKDAHNDS